MFKQVINGGKISARFKHDLPKISAGFGSDLAAFTEPELRWVCKHGSTQSHSSLLVLLSHVNHEVSMKSCKLWYGRRNWIPSSSSHCSTPGEGTYSRVMSQEDTLSTNPSPFSLALEESVIASPYPPHSERNALRTYWFSEERSRKTPSEWSMFRVLFLRGGNVYANFLECKWALYQYTIPNMIVRLRSYCIAS